MWVLISECHILILKIIKIIVDSVLHRNVLTLIVMLTSSINSYDSFATMQQCHPLLSGGNLITGAPENLLVMNHSNNNSVNSRI